MRSFSIQIPLPCHERWDDMQPIERGRFCASCQKTVIDYTTLSDQELIRLLGKASEAGCGRFHDKQLNHLLAASNSKTIASWRQWLGLLTLSLFGWQSVRAQDQPTIDAQRLPPAQSCVDRPNFSVAALPARKASEQETTLLVSGYVMLMDTSGHVSPASNAHVYAGRFETRTDSTGAYTLSVSSQTSITKLTVSATMVAHLPRQLSVDIAPSTESVTLNDIILRQPGPTTVITTGGIAIVRKTSRWQTLKRKLFRL